MNTNNLSEVVLKKLEKDVRTIPNSVVPVHIIKAGRDSGLCVMNIVVKGGSNKDKIGKEGTAHFLEHMIFCGTNDGKTEEEISSIFQETGTSYNAYTSIETTVFSIKTIAEKEYITKAIKNMVKCICNSSFPQDKIDRERTVIQSERASYDEDPDSFVGDMLAGYAFTGTVYESPIIGNKNSIDAITREDLIEHHHREFVQSNIFVTIAASTEELENAMIESLSGLSYLDAIYCPGEIANYKTDINIKPKETPVIHTKDLSQSYVRHIWNGIEALGPDAAAYDIICDVIGGGGMNSRLFKKIRRELGMAYSVGVYPMSVGNLLLPVIYATINERKEEGYINAVDAIVENILKDGITEEELKSARINIVTKILYAIENIEVVLHFTNILVMQNKESSHMVEYYHKLWTISKEEVVDSASKIFGNKPLVVILN